MPMATITKVSGERNLYHIHILDPHAGHPDHGLPGSEVDPGFGAGRPGIDHPANRPPGSGRPNFPDNSLPSGPPPHVAAGATLVLVRDPAGVWHYATLPAGTPPPVVAPPIAPTPAPKPA
jgi:hypothetical protein